MQGPRLVQAGARRGGFSAPALQLADAVAVKEPPRFSVASAESDRSQTLLTPGLGWGLQRSCDEGEAAGAARSELWAPPQPRLWASLKTSSFCSVARRILCAAQGLPRGSRVCGAGEMLRSEERGEKVLPPSLSSPGTLLGWGMPVEHSSLPSPVQKAWGFFPVWWRLSWPCRFPAYGCATARAFFQAEEILVPQFCPEEPM